MGILTDAHASGFEHAIAELDLDAEDLEKIAGLGGLVNRFAPMLMPKLRSIGRQAGWMTGLTAKPGALQAGTHSMEGLAGRVATPGALGGASLSEAQILDRTRRMDLATRNAQFQAERQALRSNAIKGHPEAFGPQPMQGPPKPNFGQRAQTWWANRTPNQRLGAAALGGGAGGMMGAHLLSPAPDDRRYARPY